ncbi:MAG: hypothetical protein AB7S26_11390 [Sandaracinaceae bacterium]
MPASELALPIALIGGLAALLLAGAQTLRLWAARGAAARRLASHKRRADDAELAAERLLIERGYRIEARQVRARVRYLVDGEDATVDVRADLTVRRGGRRYVAEVKSGERAVRPTDRATRRQLLEYARAFEVERVLLVDPEAGSIREVELPSNRAASSPLPIALAGFLLGLAVGVGLAAYHFVR